jgi:hypothetical protein
VEKSEIVSRARAHARHTHETIIDRARPPLAAHYWARAPLVSWMRHNALDLDTLVRGLSLRCFLLLLFVFVFPLCLHSRLMSDEPGLATVPPMEERQMQPTNANTAANHALSSLSFATLFVFLHPPRLSLPYPLLFAQLLLIRRGGNTPHTHTHTTKTEKNTHTRQRQETHIHTQTMTAARVQTAPSSPPDQRPMRSPHAQ